MNASQIESSLVGVIHSKNIFDDKIIFVILLVSMNHNVKYDSFV